MSQFYAVRVGRSPGLYHSWNECQAQVSGYPGCKFQKFKTLAEANEFLSRDGGTQGCIDELLELLWVVVLHLRARSGLLST
jgi:viroplasmin and RNaseH domain-containing protein